MANADSRLIRVFLSSTFVDFQEERSLLVQQVFPSLRRRARSRGVEIVDVDLRWGVTEEQTKRGETLPLCLGEIDRCRPYFISLLGERYGWVPPPDYYKPELLERQPWLRERLGGASVTELEILHGVLRNPEMAGHACFYFRDPAYAQARSAAGWVADTPTERQRLAALKARIRASGFPVAEGLANPQAIAERIEADLWQLIESRFPELEPADALEREERKHADYRRARTALYLGGEPAIEQLESWIAQGEQRILITGDSGAGKSALIANWLEAHQRNQPQDLVHAHHLGCTNDASAVRPLLGRLIDTASQLLLAEQQITEPLKVPQEWWELVFKVGEVFALLSSWCQRQGRRWILVLDGLDRLAEDDQQALPWIPTTIPPGIHVLASALDGPARTILQERHYRSHAIGPLGAGEQQQLIERYLSRYTKQLESGLQRRILAHPLAGSPLFLRVLLEELRQCACFDTLAEQLEFYRAAETIDGLYARVLERLERAGHGEATRKALTALWASRAGLSEEELLAITGLATLQWAPIDLALEQALGRNGNRLVFEHEYLQRAVENRYLTSKEKQRHANGKLADWFAQQDFEDSKSLEEYAWQLLCARRISCLRNLLLSSVNLALLVSKAGVHATWRYWRATKSGQEPSIEDLIHKDVLQQLDRLKDEPSRCIVFMERIAGFLEEVGLYCDLSVSLREKILFLTQSLPQISLEEKIATASRLAESHRIMGHIDIAISMYYECLQHVNEIGEVGIPKKIEFMAVLANIELDRRHFIAAGRLLNRCQKLLGLTNTHTSLYTLVVRLALADFQYNICNVNTALRMYRDYISETEFYLGNKHLQTLLAYDRLGSVLQLEGYSKEAEDLHIKSLRGYTELLGGNHPLILRPLYNLASLLSKKKDFQQAESLFNRIFNIYEYYPFWEKSIYYNTLYLYAKTLSEQQRFLDAIPLREQEIEYRESCDRDFNSSTITSKLQLASDYFSVVRQSHSKNIDIAEYYDRCINQLCQCLDYYKESGRLDKQLVDLFRLLAIVSKSKNVSSASKKFIATAKKLEKLLWSRHAKKTIKVARLVQHINVHTMLEPGSNFTFSRMLVSLQFWQKE